MKRDQLKPYVFKVEGAKNFAFYNMLTGDFYRFSPEGSVEDLRNQLLKEGLIFETKGIVPAKLVKVDLMELRSELFLRTLQIRLNGKGEDSCWNRKKKNSDTYFMTKATLKRLIELCRHIPINRIRVEAEIFEKEKIDLILTEFKVDHIEMFIEDGLNDKQKESLKNKFKDVGIEFFLNGKKDIKGQKIKLFTFLYSQFFNPCLGHQVAIDMNGDIKGCLWFAKTLGNVHTDDIKAIISRGDFNLYWNSHKMKIESCKECELRQVCDDCRVDQENHNLDFYAKPTYCDYDPVKGC